MLPKDSPLPNRRPLGHRPLTPFLQISHSPQNGYGGATTRSPTLKRVTAAPTSSITPTNSWPMTNGGQGGRKPSA